MAELTELQRDLPERMIRRDLDAVDKALCGCFEFRLINEIEKRMVHGGEVTVLDSGCGAGTAIEQLVRVAPAWLREELFVRGNVSGIGIDINPLPELIPEDILRIDPETGEKSEDTSWPIQASIRQDDMKTLKTVPDRSVDVLYSVGGLTYVDDALRALEAGWRVLKKGGIMAYEVLEMNIAQPGIREILATTRGAMNVFSIRERPTMNDYRVEYGFIVGEKKKRHSFKGFPWRMVDVDRRLAGCDDHYRHVVIGQYEKIAGDKRLIAERL